MPIPYERKLRYIEQERWRAVEMRLEGLPLSDDLRDAIRKWGIAFANAVQHGITPRYHRSSESATTQ